MPLVRYSLCVSPRAEQRLSFALDFLRAIPPREPALLLVPSSAAGTQLMARLLAPGEARFGWRRRSFEGLARELALPELAREGRVPLASLALEALVTRVVHELVAERGLGRFTPLAERPGFVRALTATLGELRLAAVTRERLAACAPELARVLAAYEAALAEQALADRAHVLAAARRACEPGRADAFAPLLALDIPLAHQAEALFAQALCAVPAHAAVTVARGDERSEAHWRGALGHEPQIVRLEPDLDDELARLQARLFATASFRSRAEPRASTASAHARAAAASSGRAPAVALLSSPGEAREAVEVARAVLAAAAEGVPFDRMAIALRAVESYRAVVEEALARAELPAHFADGLRRPQVEGRAFLALLACARDGLSARAFAEYLSLGALVRQEGEAPPSPRRWERLLVEAAVVGGRERWARRLAGLARQWGDELEALDVDDPRREALARDRDLLTGLERFALPLLDALAALPEGAAWGAWIPALTKLARASLAEPDGVCGLLSELAPLAPVGPVSTHDVLRVLAPRLSSVLVGSTGHGAGKVFVGAIEDLRGRSFDRVFVLGLAERLFPARIGEDAFLPDQVRRALGAELWLTEERVAHERLLLRIAVGAARARLCLSFPRFDLTHGRPRVPSFYGLEVLQAIDGSLPAFDELSRRADPGAAARMGFPAPAQAELAIDDAEYDLAMLDRLMRAPASERRGAARYLLGANAHLARALRFRARRWELARFAPADGFVAAGDAGKALLAPMRLDQRAYSATALAHFAICPYRFFLYAIVGLAERGEAVAVDELDARQRGVLFHRVQRAVLSELSTRGCLPLTREALGDARALLAHVFARLVAEAREDYAPSIESVFDAGLATVRRDLGEWLERLVDEQRFLPLHFELGFGRARGRELDPASRREPVQLAAGVKLVGAIDLVERAIGPADAPLLRATDYKTSAPPESLALGVVSGGRVLQPLFYALALEQLFPGAKVAGGRLYFCTARGSFASHEVALEPAARAVARDLVERIDEMIGAGFLPAAPALQPEDRARAECERCAYRVICGPYEAERVGQVKSRELARLAPLAHVRNLP